jgi:hypothetical protein
MRPLLDTHVFLWYITADPRFPAGWWHPAQRKPSWPRGMPTLCPGSPALKEPLEQPRPSRLTLTPTSPMMDGRVLLRETIMSRLQTIEQITSDFPSEWVLIGEPQTDEKARLQGGRVVFHSPNRDDVYRKAVELRLPHFAVRFLGTMPEDTALVL